MKRLLAGTINHRRAEDGWENVHLDINPRDIWDVDRGAVPVDVVADLADGLPMFKAREFDEIVCHHVLEHMTMERGELALKAMARVLRRGGILDIECPDMDRICAAWIEGTFTRYELQQWIYGEALDHYDDPDVHRSGWWPQALSAALELAGFDVPAREETGLAVRYRAVKR